MVWNPGSGGVMHGRATVELETGAERQIGKQSIREDRGVNIPVSWGRNPRRFLKRWMLRLSFPVLAILPAVSPAAAANPGVVVRLPTPVSGPARFGWRDLRAALAAAGETVVVQNGSAPAGGAFRLNIYSPGRCPKPLAGLVPGGAESFLVQPEKGGLNVCGRDDTGLMYALLELAERVRNGAALAAVPRLVRRPFLAVRAVNAFLSLPYPFRGKDRWAKWWFRSPDFWKTYLDMLARSRINWLDLHGMYAIRSTGFPNIYPYFLTAPDFPRVGLPAAERAANLAMLETVVRMARARGIHVALMDYHASWRVPGAPHPPYAETSENLTRYTRECVAQLLRRAPGLDMIGFRIGESGRREDFYEKSYLAGIEEARKPVRLYTRTWGARRSSILDLGRRYPGRFYIEIKYNGEQFGLPYIVAGGRMARWRDYSYQDYCRPPEPYRIIWQIRANGTHRLFRWGDPEWVSRAVRASVLDGAVGVSVEPMNAYYPQYDYYHKEKSLRWFRWVVQRDWFWYMLWGRLGYEPRLPEATWKAAFARHFGAADIGGAMLDLVKSMSRIVPLIYAVHCQGPDHRNMAPEFETGGPIDRFALTPPLDTFAIQSIPEFVARTLRNQPSARTTPLEMAAMLDAAAGATRARLRSLARRPAPERRGELEDWRADAQCLAALGAYYAAKVRAATYLQFYQATRDEPHWRRARRFMARAVKEWEQLSALGDRFYHPFVDTLRMHTEKFLWSRELPQVKKDLVILDRIHKRIAKSGGAVRSGVEPPARTSLSLAVTWAPQRQSASEKTFKITAAPVSGAGFAAGTRAWLHWKYLPSEHFWHSQAMRPAEGGFSAILRVTPLGAQWAVEVVGPRGGACWPDWRKETPYRVVEAWNGPVPAIGAAGRIPDLTRQNLSRARFAALLCGRTATALDSLPKAQKQRLLAAVAAGQTLVIFNQDYPQRFHASWLPGGIRGTDADRDRCELRGPHPLLEGLPNPWRGVKIVNDALAGGDSAWRKLTEPCALALLAYGKGRILLVQVPVFRNATDPACGRLLRNVLDFARRGSSRPFLVLDPGNGEMQPVLDLLNVNYVTWQDPGVTAP